MNTHIRCVFIRRHDIFVRIRSPPSIVLNFKIFKTIGEYIQEATPEKVAYFTMRLSSDPDFLNNDCKKIYHSEDDVSLDSIIFHL